MKKNNKTCICCGKIYTYCNSCPQYITEPTWKAIFHDENCKKIFMAVSDYLGSEKTKDESKAILEACDLSDKDKFNIKVKDTINDICRGKTEDKRVDVVEKKSTSKSKDFNE